MAYTLFENDQWSISLDQVTWIEKKRDGGICIHFPGSDVVLMNKNYGPAFMEAYAKYHAWRSAPPAARPAQPTGPQQPPRPQQPTP